MQEAAGSCQGPSGVNQASQPGQPSSCWRAVSGQSPVVTLSRGLAPSSCEGLSLFQVTIFIAHKMGVML